MHRKMSVYILKEIPLKAKKVRRLSAVNFIKRAKLVFLSPPLQTSGKIPLIELSVCSSIDCFFPCFYFGENESDCGKWFVSVWAIVVLAFKFCWRVVITRPSAYICSRKRTVCGTYCFHFRFVFVVVFVCRYRNL